MRLYDLHRSKSSAVSARYTLPLTQKRRRRHSIVIRIYIFPYQVGRHFYSSSRMDFLSLIAWVFTLGVAARYLYLLYASRFAPMPSDSYR